ncbi:membrane-bound PQQ-dependent dehydrogenase, glucose/quinate/shikimate family [Orbus wheelerorum]|uniref:membrane-bound PQQ-dependent dehydrogenase, glucose/quinate/shikimate family n=1 Tax=Orbus wheelerorum TaxID=3074111 RepID=UPI00370D2658
MDIQNKPKGLRKCCIYLVAIILLLSSLFLVINGIRLIIVGGSWYFALMGLTMLFCSIALFKYRPIGAIVYGIAYVITIIWALIEVGWQFWPLFSRLAVLGGFAILVALIYPSLIYITRNQKSLGGYRLASVLIIVMIISLGCMSVEHNAIYKSIEISKNNVTSKNAPTDWQQYANTTMGTRFSGAEQITKDNINDLKVAWTFRTGEIPESNGSGAEDQNTPLQIDDTVYLCTANNIVIAVDADNGNERWRYDPKTSVPNWQRCRGLAYYSDQNKTHITSTKQDVDGANTCSSRIILTTLDARLMAIDPQSGQLCNDFGDAGIVDLKKNMGDIPPGYYTITSAPLVADDVIVVGGRVADNFSVGEPGGVIRAFDVHSGKLVWAFDPGNPDTKTVPPSGQNYTRGTVNVWTSMAYDPELELIYAPTGNATPDFFGGERTKYDDEYNSSIVALDKKTGQIRWKFRTAHHDLWDYDLPSQPLLYDIANSNDEVTKAIIQTTKSGQIFMLDRETGQPLAKVEEHPVPQGDVAGEYYSPTQPFSVEMPSIGNETLTEADMWGATIFDQLLCRIDFAGSDYQGLFTPPGMSKTLQYPGSLGGMNWGGVAVDPQTNIMYVNDMRIGLTNWMIPRADIPANASGIEMGIVPQDGTPFGAMRLRFMSPIGVPCQKPPYGTMTAIDLKSKQILWQKPVGTLMDTGIFNIPMHMPIPIGMPTIGGSMTTKSGLLFFAATQDFYLRAFDSATGEEVWKARLPVGSQGTPITYISPKTGKQYIVISAGGARQSPKRGDYVIAYALPDNK